MFVVAISELTLISRNGRDQINSSAALRMAARVRSDFITPAAGFGTARNLDDALSITDTLSAINDVVSNIFAAKTGEGREGYAVFWNLK